MVTLLFSASMNQNSRHQKEVDVGVNSIVCSYFKDSKAPTAVLNMVGSFLMATVPDDSSSQAGLALLSYRALGIL